MSWLSDLRIFLGHDEVPSVRVDNESQKEAVHSKEKAKQALGEAIKRREEVREVTSALTTLRARNHFGESIQLAMMRKGD